MNGIQLPIQLNNGNHFKCLQIEGIPKENAGFFFVNFNKGKDDISVSFEVCFNYNGNNNEILGYTYSNGKKDIKVCPARFPFKTQTSFTMEIRPYEKNALEVYVNKNKIWEYADSLKIPSFTAVRVDGDLELSNFVIEEFN